jgi:hypothetical protein
MSDVRACEPWSAMLSVEPTEIETRTNVEQSFDPRVYRSKVGAQR